MKFEIKDKKLISFKDDKHSAKVVVPSCEEIDCGVFYNCAWIEEIILPEGLTRIGRDGKIFFSDMCIFKNCTSLKKINIPDSVRHIQASSFENCTALEEIVLPKFLTEITNSLFKDCISLKRVVASSVTHVGKEAFCGCENLEYVRLADNFVSEEYAFANCKFTEKDLLCERVKAIPTYAFSGWLFKSATIPEGVEYIGNDAFADCKNLEYIKLPKSLKTVGERAFKNCENLIKVDFEGDVKFLQNAFFGCGSVDPVSVIDNVDKIFESGFGDDVPPALAVGYDLRNHNRRQKVSLGLSFLYHHEQYPENESKEYLKYLYRHRNFLIPYAVMRKYYRAVDGAISLGLIDLHKTYDYEKMLRDRGETGYADAMRKYRAEKFSSVQIACEERRQEERDKVTAWDFYEKDGEITLRAYRGWKDDIFVPDTLCGKPVVAIEGKKFAPYATKISFPDGIRIGEKTLSSSRFLRSVEFRGKVEGNLPYSVFYRCVELREITFPEGLREIPSFAFTECDSLKKVVIPEGVTDIKYSAFMHCGRLEEVVLPSSVQRICARAFDSYPSLKYIRYNGTAESFAKINEGTYWRRRFPLPIIFNKRTDYGEYILFERAPNLPCVNDWN